MQPGGLRIHRPDPDPHAPCSRCGRLHPGTAADGRIDVDELHQWHTSRRLLGAAICLRCVRDDDIEAVNRNLAGLLALSTYYSADPVHTEVTEAAFATVAGGRRPCV
jgi:hypothetical protein